MQKSEDSATGIAVNGTDLPAHLAEFAAYLSIRRCAKIPFGSFNHDYSGSWTGAEGPSGNRLSLGRMNASEPLFALRKVREMAKPRAVSFISGSTMDTSPA